MGKDPNPDQSLNCSKFSPNTSVWLGLRSLVGLVILPGGHAEYPVFLEFGEGFEFVVV